MTQSSPPAPRLSSPKLRLFIDQPLAAGASALLSSAQAHYLAHVMRAKPGEPVKLFNGLDGEWLARLDTLGKKGGSVIADSQMRPQKAEPDIWLVFAPIKGPRFDNITEKATELGIARLVPVTTRHCVVSRINMDRMANHAVEAAEQCERLSVPVIDPLRPLDDVLRDWDPARRLIHLDESGGGRPLVEALAGVSPGPCALLVGPEGGFAKSELDAIAKLAFALGVGLGPRILRADTAAIAALACLQAWRGDWADAPAFRSQDDS